MAAVRDLGFRVGGQLQAFPDSAYDVLLFALPNCAMGNVSSNLHSLGRIAVRTDGDGQATFTQAWGIPRSDTDCLLARTMDATGDTSELSAPLPVAVELTYWKDVAIRLAGSADVARPAEPFRFLITLENLSETAEPRPPLNGLAVTFPLPAGVWFHSASDGAVWDGAAVRFAGLTVPADEAVSLEVTVLPLLVETLVASASVDDSGPYQANNLATLAVAVDQSDVRLADLALTMTAEPVPVRVGMELQYRLAITNQGPADAPDVVVTNWLPETARLLRTELRQGRVTAGHNVVIAALGTLTNGASAELTVTVQPTASGWLTNAARVVVPSGLPEGITAWAARSALDGPGELALVTDPNPTNSQAVVEVDVLPPQPLEPLESPTFNPQTGLYEQLVRFTNVGTEPWSGVRLWVREPPPGVLIVNQSGVEEGVPFLQLGRPFEGAETYTFTVEFYRADRLPVTAPGYEAVEHPGDADRPPPDPGGSPLRLRSRLDGSDCVLSWDARFGRVYVVQGRPRLPEPWRTASAGLIFSTDHGTWTASGVRSADDTPTANRFFRLLELP